MEKHKGNILADKQCLKFPKVEIPFVRDEQFVIPPRTRQVIYAKVANSDVEVGHVELQRLQDGLLFGNFLGTNRKGKVYAVILNISDSEITIHPPEVTLHTCETTQIRGDIFDDDPDEFSGEKEQARVLSLVTEDFSKRISSDPRF